MDNRTEKSVWIFVDTPYLLAPQWVIIPLNLSRRSAKETV